MNGPKHCARGDATGRINQPKGRHRSGTGYIPAGDRNRCRTALGIDTVEERDSDPNVRRI